MVVDTFLANNHITLGDQIFHISIYNDFVDLKMELS